MKASICLLASVAALFGCSTHGGDTPVVAVAAADEPLPVSVGRSSAPTTSTQAFKDGKSNRGTSLTEQRHYFDGGVKRTIWVSPDQVAELAPDDTGQSVVLRFDPNAVEQPTLGAGARVWRLSAGQSAIRACADLSAADPGHCISPILHIGSTANSPARALPGGVLITLPSDWTPDAVRTWLAANDLTLTEELAAPANSLLVASAPGLDCLELANSLQTDADVLSATPNFWIQSATR